MEDIKKSKKGSPQWRREAKDKMFADFKARQDEAYRAKKERNKLRFDDI